jgi:hypothetical protein
MIRWIVRLFPIRVIQFIQALPEPRAIDFRHLDAGEHAAIIGTMVAVMEHSDIPVVSHAVQEL